MFGLLVLLPGLCTRLAANQSVRQGRFGELAASFKRRCVKMGQDGAAAAAGAHNQAIRFKVGFPNFAWLAGHFRLAPCGWVPNDTANAHVACQANQQERMTFVNEITIEHVPG
jgi:hypothetical protein